MIKITKEAEEFEQTKFDNVMAILIAFLGFIPLLFALLVGKKVKVTVRDSEILIKVKDLIKKGYTYKEIKREVKKWQQ